MRGSVVTRELTEQEEAALFWRLRTRIAFRLADQFLSQSRLRAAVLLLLSGVFWVGMFVLFFEGFRFLRIAIEHDATRAQTVQAIYNIFFLSLLVMLTVSSGIVLYSAVFNSEEVSQLLTSPARAERILIHKFQETVVFTGWGFILLGSPLLVAYGLVSSSPWYYFALILPFMISFVVIPTSVGAILCLLIIHQLPSLRWHALVVIGTSMVLALIFVGWSFMSTDGDMMTAMWFQNMLTRLQYAEQRILPSWWLSSGLLEAAHPAAATTEGLAWRESLGFLSVLIANACVGVLTVGLVGKQCLRTGFGQLKGLGRKRRRKSMDMFDEVVLWVTRPFNPAMRQLLVKDLRIFRRDPIHWSQFLIFFGLLGLYFINVRRLQYGGPMDAWMTMVGFLNVAVVGLILSTFTTRFIFPMISMEGRRFWVLGTLPIHRDTILWGKLLFACFVSVLPCAGLVLLSDIVLKIVERAPFVALIHQLTCWSMCIGLSALAVGLGARLPDFRESSPSRIAAGFGGTLNLVLSALFIMATVLPTGVTCYCWLNRQNGFSGGDWFSLGSFSSVIAGLLIAMLAGLMATYLPLRAGFRAFRRLEF